MWWRTYNCSLLLIDRPREDERLSWPGWLTYSGRLTHISGHPSARGRAQDGERTLARDWRSTAEPCWPTPIWSPIQVLTRPGVKQLCRCDLCWVSSKVCCMCVKMEAGCSVPQLQWCHHDLRICIFIFGSHLVNYYCIVFIHDIFSSPHHSVDNIWCLSGGNERRLSELLRITSSMTDI